MANPPSSSEPGAVDPALTDPTGADRGAGEPTTRPLAAGDGPTGHLTVAWRSDGGADERSGEEALELLPRLLAEPDSSIWIDLRAPAPREVEQVGAILRLHPLIVEDVLEGNQRPKAEVTNGLVHLVLFRLAYENDELEATEVDLVLGPGFVLSVHDGTWDPRAGHALRGGAGTLLARGPDHMLWALCDAIVDDYFPLGDRIGDAMDAAQDEVFRDPDPEVLERVFRLKRDLHEIRRLVSPVREVFNQLTNRDIGLIDDNEVIYFRDVYDHLIRLTDELDNYRELAAATLDVYLTQVNNNLSVIMKRLTGVTVLLAGIGAVAGIFGMSEAALALQGAEAAGFWVVALGIVTTAAIAAVVLRRFDWI